MADREELLQKVDPKGFEDAAEKPKQKTPDDIKKGLACCLGDCHDYHCEECPYDCETEGMDLANDTLALIQQLEAQNAELLEKVKQLEPERDAAVFDIKKFGRSLSRCSICSKSEDEERCSHGLGFCFEWRGLCEENGGDPDA